MAFNQELSEFFTQLWEEDSNRLTHNVDFAIDTQGYTRVKADGEKDYARKPLFTWVKDEVLQRDTYKKFIALLDNYETETGIAEVVTPQEEQENRAFLKAVMETKVMKLAHQYLVSKGKAPGDEFAFMKDVLYDLWFKLYRRTRGERSSDSSGFEHVFVGEVKRGTDDVMGLHNWIQFYLQEKKGHIDYKGWIPPRGMHPKSVEQNPYLVTIQFTWKGDVKPIGGSFVGTSPEFEMALYTVCFLMGSKKTNVKIADMEVQIVCYRFGKEIGTSYPEAL